MTDTLELLLQESEVKIKLIVDNSPMIESLSAKTRFEVGRRFSLLDDLIKDKVECIAFATGSYLAKVMLSTLMLIKRPQVTYKVFDTTDEALGWVKTF